MGRSNTVRTRGQEESSKDVVAVDLFCGAGGLTRGLLDAGVQVVAGYDVAPYCKYAYERNNCPAKFMCTSVVDISASELKRTYPKDSWKILVGCAPCQPFSTYTQGSTERKDDRWSLLAEFARLVQETRPDVISMENVVGLTKHGVYADFVESLESSGYWLSTSQVYCPDYGIPQQRTRLVLLASKLGPLSLVRPTHSKTQYRSVRKTIEDLPDLCAGQVNEKDPLHRAARLSKINLKRIQKSTPGGTWRDWPPELVATCHSVETGKTYAGVYGRMAWDDPSPTITTQFYGFGNGRFGHPEQDRGLSLREGALIQTFKRGYEFTEEAKDIHFKTIGRMIGNAVPVRLGEIIGRSICRHVRQYES